MSEYKKQKFYWLKLNENFFDDDSIRWLEERENGKEYSLFYLKLCLKSIKNEGILIREVGNLLIPYDTAKLAELTNTSVDTVTVAITLLTKIGLVQILENGALYLTQVQKMLGVQSLGAYKKKIQRLNSTGGQVADICPPEIDIDIRDRTKDIEKEEKNNLVILKEEKKSNRFFKPSLEELQNYIDENNYHFQADKFIAYYESKGWMIGNSPMKNWQAACRTWELKWKEQHPYFREKPENEIEESEVDDTDLNEILGEQI